MLVLKLKENVTLNQLTRSTFRQRKISNKWSVIASLKKEHNRNKLHLHSTCYSNNVGFVNLLLCARVIAQLIQYILRRTN